MAPNKFATMLHRNTNRITLVLVYAVLEWALIFFLLLNSLFSYLIIKFANFFGLEPPCLLCSRLDHVFESQNSEFSYRNLICEHHANELSRSGYSLRHQKLVESHDMCGNFSSTQEDDHQHLSAVSVLRWLKEIGIVESDWGCMVVENNDEILGCSCCGLIINRHILSNCAVINPSLVDSEDAHKESRDETCHNIDLDGELVQKGTDSSPIVCSEQDRMESSRDAEGPDSDPTKEDENPVSFCFWLSNEGYTPVGADEDDSNAVLESEEEPLITTATLTGSYLKEDERDVVWEAEIEPLLGGSIASRKSTLEDEGDVLLGEEVVEPLLSVGIGSIKCSYANELIIPQDLEFYINVHEYQQLVPLELIKMESEKDGEIHVVATEEHEKATQPWGDRDEWLILQRDSAATPATVDDAERLNASFELLKSEEAEVEEVLNRQDQDLDIKSLGDSKLELDEAMVEESSSEKGQEEEAERDVGDDVALDADSAGISSTIQRQEEPAMMVIDSLVAPEQSYDVPLADIDDQAVEEEVSELNGVYHIVSGKIDGGNYLEPIDKNEAAESIIPYEEEECSCSHNVICEANASSIGLLENGGYGSSQSAENQIHDHIALPDELKEWETVSTLDKLSSTGNVYNMQREMLLLQRMGSFDGEILGVGASNEVNSGDEAVAVEGVESVLNSERKALRALYTELEEERNAAAIATNQTMAMINRLQEEKATIEMEALQYQRMMEEQSEYDQEALQLMNEILVKREKEIQELENELEIYRKKVMDYEERERRRLIGQRKDMNDGTFADLNSNKSEEAEGCCKIDENGYHHNTPIDAILGLQDSLSTFEEERISILVHLKVLEEKLCTLAEEEENHIGSMKPFEQFYQENAKEFERNSHITNYDNGMDSGSSNTNGKYNQEWRMNGQKPKQLLPFFNASELVSDDEQFNGAEDVSDSFVKHKPLSKKYELEEKRLAIEEEVDNLYERLHALEVDREFLKHCFGSLKKGDRGVDILQEILQHLRDLKNLELQAKNAYDVSLLKAQSTKTTGSIISIIAS